jgi:ATP-dependent helicase YprA (DUF1998 family)
MCGRLLITNPDMLHCSLLPVHKDDGNVQRFLANLVSGRCQCSLNVP